MDREQMAGIMEHETWDEAKLPAVDPTIPGIGAPIIWDGDETVPPRGIILVRGRLEKVCRRGRRAGGLIPSGS